MDQRVDLIMAGKKMECKVKALLPKAERKAGRIIASL